MMQNIRFRYEVGAYLFFVASVSYDCHQSHLTHPFSGSSSFILG